MGNAFGVDTNPNAHRVKNTDSGRLFNVIFDRP